MHKFNIHLPYKKHSLSPNFNSIQLFSLNLAMCGSPLAVPHARNSAPLDQPDFAIDAMVQYTCFPGYESKGFAKAKCLFYNGTAQWFGPDLKCIRE